MLERAPPWTVPAEKETHTPPQMRPEQTVMPHHQDYFAFFCKMFIKRSELIYPIQYLPDA